MGIGWLWQDSWSTWRSELFRDHSKDKFPDLNACYQEWDWRIWQSLGGFVQRGFTGWWVRRSGRWEGKNWRPTAHVTETDRQKHKERRKQQETQEKEAKHLHHDMFFCEGIVSCLVLFIFNLADFIQAGRECHKATVMCYFTLSCIYIYIYCNFHPRCNPSMAEIISPLWCKLSLTGSRLHHVRLLSWKTNQCERLKDKPSTHRQQTAGGGKIISMWLTTWKTMWGQNSTHRSQERSLI